MLWLAELSAREGSARNPGFNRKRRATGTSPITPSLPTEAGITGRALAGGAERHLTVSSSNGRRAWDIRTLWQGALLKTQPIVHPLSGEGSAISISQVEQGRRGPIPPSSCHRHWPGASPEVRSAIRPGDDPQTVRDARGLGIRGPNVRIIDTVCAPCRICLPMMASCGGLGLDSFSCLTGVWAERPATGAARGPKLVVLRCGTRCRKPNGLCVLTLD